MGAPTQAGRGQCRGRPERFAWVVGTRSKTVPDRPSQRRNAALTEYEDKSAIVEVLNLYGFALDAREWDLFDRIFTPDVIAEFPPAGPACPVLDVFKLSCPHFHDPL